jgi:hypothetical protein
MLDRVHNCIQTVRLKTCRFQAAWGTQALGVDARIILELLFVNWVVMPCILMGSC